MKLNTPSNSKNHSIISQRLYWYRENMSEKLTRYKHALIIIFVLFVPTLTMLGSFVTPPILAVIMPHPSSLQVLSYQIGLQIIFMGWLALQGDAVTGQPSREFINTLPLKISSILFTDIAVLVVANILLWIPILLAIFLAPYNLIHGVSESIAYFLRVVNLLASIICVQLICVNKRYFFLFCVFIADVITTISTFILNDYFFVNSVLFINLLILSLLPVVLLLKNPWNLLNREILSSIKHFYITHTVSPEFFASVKLQIAILFRKYKLVTLIRSISSLCILTVGICMICLSKTNFNTFTVSNIFLTFNTFILTGFYQRLYESHQAYREYTSTLPVNKYFCGILDFKFVTSVLLAQSLCFVAILYFSYRLNFLQAISLLICQIPLSILLYFTQNRMGKMGTLVSVCTSALWCALIFIL